MRVELMFPSKYLKAADFGGKAVTKTIAAVDMDDLQMRGGKTERKPVVTFSDAKKMLVLNKTNAMKIAELLGPETDAWIGKRVTMYPTRDRMGGKMVDCIRIKGSPDAVKHDDDGVVADDLPPEAAATDAAAE